MNAAIINQVNIKPRKTVGPEPKKRTEWKGNKVLHTAWFFRVGLTARCLVCSLLCYIISYRQFSILYFLYSILYPGISNLDRFLYRICLYIRLSHQGPNAAPVNTPVNAPILASNKPVMIHRIDHHLKFMDPWLFPHSVERPLAWTWIVLDYSPSSSPDPPPSDQLGSLVSATDSSDCLIQMPACTGNLGAATNISPRLFSIPPCTGLFKLLYGQLTLICQLTIHSSFPFFSPLLHIRFLFTHPPVV